MNPLAQPVTSVDTANDRLKGSFGSVFWSAMILATGLHFAAFALWPEVTVADYSFTAAELATVNLPPDVKIPDAPTSIARPAVPVVATTDVSEDVTIAPTTFEATSVENLPPPPKEKPADITTEPTFTPYTVAPFVLNKNEVVQAMAKVYPPMLRDAGIGGTVLIYFFIDEMGVIKDHRVWRSSGHWQLDSAALQVADVYRFSPALNRDKKVPVWVQFPIKFEVR